jgi:peptide/nickel transport system permease protein
LFEIVYKRLAYSLLLFFGITLLSFWVIHLAPGTPGQARAGFGGQAGSEAADKLNHLYGLDRPLWDQYHSWLFKMVCFDFGESLVDGEKVSVKILKTIPVTLALNAISLILTLGLGIPLGVWLALRKGTRPERWVSFFSLAAISLPSFWISLVLMSWLGVRLGIFPVSGLRSVFYEDHSRIWQWADLLWHTVLPVAVITLSGTAVFSRYVKASMEEVLEKDFIRAARARGLAERSVVYGHALKNALLPVVTLLGLSVPALLGGSVVLETVFSIPGMGRLFYSAVFSRDYPVLMGVLSLGAVLTLLGNALADLAYATADPRIRRTGPKP